MRKADVDLYDAIVGELASVEKNIKDSEACHFRNSDVESYP
jgi:hypothetical protein